MLIPVFYLFMSYPLNPFMKQFPFSIDRNKYQYLFLDSFYLDSLMMRWATDYKRCFDQTIFTNSLEKKSFQYQELKDAELLQGKYPIQRKKIVAIYCSNRKYSKDLEKSYHSVLIRLLKQNSCKQRLLFRLKMRKTLSYKVQCCRVIYEKWNHSLPFP